LKVVSTPLKVLPGYVLLIVFDRLIKVCKAAELSFRILLTSDRVSLRNRSALLGTNHILEGTYA
jgi:hypothetical protein